MSGENGFTKTEQCLMSVLRDGQPHTKKELLASLPDPLTDFNAMKQRIFVLRKKLTVHRQDILCVYFNHSTHYQLVRLISMDESAV